MLNARSQGTRSLAQLLSLSRLMINPPLMPLVPLPLIPCPRFPSPRTTACLLPAVAALFLFLSLSLSLIFPFPSLSFPSVPTLRLACLLLPLLLLPRLPAETESRAGVARVTAEEIMSRGGTATSDGD